MTKPLILSPAGSYEAMLAAISAGADEVYFGASAFNARAYAKGFTREELEEGIMLCKLCGVKTNVTLNTLVTDREMSEAVEVARDLWEMGADAFIVQDIGLCARLRESIPGIELHASTQCACHNLDGAIRLARLGFSRIVLARELCARDIEEITRYGRQSGLFETEAFIHGALCVSHSGQCLMSSVIGGRSGNRGMCAQPCRMQGCIGCDGGATVTKKGYPLSLKDLSLCTHIEELCQMGIASLKIEGRMKSPDYVYRVTGIWRELIDSGKSASAQKQRELADIFSRGGFTDSYFTEKYRKSNSDMYGIRSEDDKRRTREQETDIPSVPACGIELECDFYPGKKAKLCATVEIPCGRGYESGHKISVVAESPGEVQRATGNPMNDALLTKQFSKLGGTPFYAKSVVCNTDGAGFMPASALNALRREAVELLTKAVKIHGREDFAAREKSITESGKSQSVYRKGAVTPKKAVFVYGFDKVRKGTDEKYILPLELFYNVIVAELPDLSGVKYGVRLPRVFFEQEKDAICKALTVAKDMGATFAEVSNIGHMDVAKDAGLELWGGIGLNIYNSDSLKEYADMGFGVLTLSPELSVAQLRDIQVPDRVGICVFARGRLPLMVLESCIVKASGKCGRKAYSQKSCGFYRDRIGKDFPVVGQKRFIKEDIPACRNLILNSEISDITSKKGFERVCADYLLYESEPDMTKPMPKGKTSKHENR